MSQERTFDEDTEASQLQCLFSRLVLHLTLELRFVALCGWCGVVGVVWLVWCGWCGVVSVVGVVWLMWLV